MVAALVIVALATVGVLAARRLLRHDRDLTLDNALDRAPRLYAVGCGMLAIGAVALAAWLRPRWLWVLPPSIEASLEPILTSGVSGLLAFGFAVMVTVAFATRHARRWSVTIASLALLIALQAIAVDRARPLAPELSHREHEGVVLQSSGASCVSASAANLGRLYGIERTEAQMAELLGATRLGATSAQLVAGLAKLGLRCRRSYHRDRDIGRLTPPAVIFYGDAYGVPHAVVLVERGTDGLVVLDPLVGRTVLDPASVARSWDGEAVRCQRVPR